MLGWRNLAEIKRDSGGNNTCADTSDDSPNNHHSQVNSTSLDRGSDAKKADTTETSPSSTVLVVDRTCDEGERGELTSSKDSCDETLFAR
jgi:hypothetical protein